MELSQIVETSNAVAATRSRLRKVDLLADLLGSLTGADRDIGARYLAGAPRQERLGVGYRTLDGIRVTPAEEPVLTIAGVDDALERLAAESGAGSSARRVGLLEELLGSATSDEQRFLRSLILREVRQGALEGVGIEAVARAASVQADAVRRAAMVSGDLPTVAAAALARGARALGEFRLIVGRAVQPMLAGAAADIADAVSRHGGSARVEYKLDGARIQVHRRGSSVSVFTRNLRDVTARVPEIVAAARTFDADPFVLDGEALGLDDAGRPIPFQQTMARFGSTASDGASSVPLSAFFFDVLTANGSDMLTEPLERRVDVLRRIVDPSMLIPSIDAADEVQAGEMLSRALEAGHEGVMAKDRTSEYAAGRRGSAWLKVKPVYTLDLVVLAVEWGSGRRQGLLSNIHLGARDPGGGFVMLGKTFKGLTDEMLEWQTNRFLELEVSRSAQVVHVRPEQVVEIAFDGVQASSRYPGGVALRFARVRGYRDDKSPRDADTIDTLRRMLGSSG